VKTLTIGLDNRRPPTRTLDVVKLSQSHTRTSCYSLKTEFNEQWEKDKRLSKNKNVQKDIQNELAFTVSADMILNKLALAARQFAPSLAILGLLCFLVASLGSPGTLFFSYRNAADTTIKPTQTKVMHKLTISSNQETSSLANQAQQRLISPPNPNDIQESSIQYERSVDSAPKPKLKYYEAMDSPDIVDVIAANENLFNYAVQFISTQFYDNTGGSNYNQQEFYKKYWMALKAFAKRQEFDANQLDKNAPQLIALKNGRAWKVTSPDGKYNIEIDADDTSPPPMGAFTSRDRAVEGLKWLISTLSDPYSKYLTREELRQELASNDDGFLGIGAFVEAPPASTAAYEYTTSSSSSYASPPKDTNSQSPKLKKLAMCEYGNLVSFLSNECGAHTLEERISGSMSMLGPVSMSSSLMGSNGMLTVTRAANLPIVTAVEPNSPAERSGLVVGDRIVGVGSVNFIGMNRRDIERALETRYKGAENYAGFPELTIAKPLFFIANTGLETENSTEPKPSVKQYLVGYRSSRVKMTTSSLQPFQLYAPMNLGSASELGGNIITADLEFDSHIYKPKLAGGNKYCYWHLLSSNDSIFRQAAGSDTGYEQDKGPVGYIRLTRFSRSSTDGFIDAVEQLERLGAESYIIDVRNNYGGVVQEAMLTASSLLRDPRTVLCWTMNSRGGFTPKLVEEYVIDKRYPGYLLSTEGKQTTSDELLRYHPEFFEEGWSPPSQYASIHEQRVKRGIRVSSSDNPAAYQQKKIVLLVNEGTASSAEVFASSLRDNGRLVALVGAKTYGKGLIQHTFPMPDGGGLRLTIAEYLTPSLKHVTKVGGARYDSETGERIGGGVKPDVYCETRGIPSNPGADFCVGLALDALEDAS